MNVDVDYLLQIRDKNADRCIRELAGRLVDVIAQLREIDEPESAPERERITVSVTVDGDVYAGDLEREDL